MHQETINGEIKASDPKHNIQSNALGYSLANIVYILNKHIFKTLANIFEPLWIIQYKSNKFIDTIPMNHRLWFTYMLYKWWEDHWCRHWCCAVHIHLSSHPFAKFSLDQIFANHVTGMGENIHPMWYKMAQNPIWMWISGSAHAAIWMLLFNMLKY